MFGHLSTVELLCIAAAALILFFIGKAWFFPRKSSPMETAINQGLTASNDDVSKGTESTMKDNGQMLIATTHRVEGYRATQHMGVVTGHCIVGANVFRDVFAGITDFVGGRSRTYEKAMRNAENDAARGLIKHAQELGANAILGVVIDYETIVLKGSMMMVNMVGTAVTLSPIDSNDSPAEGSRRSQTHQDNFSATESSAPAS